MDDEQILERGGTEEDIKKSAEMNGANLTKIDVIEDEIYRELHFIRQRAGKNQLKIISEITHAIRKTFNRHYSTPLNEDK